MLYNTKTNLASGKKKTSSAFQTDAKKLLNTQTSSATKTPLYNTSTTKYTPASTTNTYQNMASQANSAVKNTTNSTANASVTNVKAGANALKNPTTTYGTSSGGATNGGGSTVTSSAVSYPAVTKFQASDATIAAMNQTQALLNKVTSGKTSYSDKLAELLAAYTNRDSFNYDPNSDLLFQNALQGAMSSGRSAMRDTMGQAADLTGGYGSSYATSVASQAYNNSIQDAYNNLTEYYQLAYNQYNNESEQMLNEVNMYNTLDQQEYSSNLNAYNASNTNWQTLYNQDYSKWNDEFSQSMDVANYNLNKLQADRDYELSQANLALNQKNYELNRQETEAKLKQYAYELEQAQAAANAPSTISNEDLDYLREAYKTAYEMYGEDAAKEAVEARISLKGLSGISYEDLVNDFYNTTESQDFDSMSFTMGYDGLEKVYIGSNNKKYSESELKALVQAGKMSKEKYNEIIRNF